MENIILLGMSDRTVNAFCMAFKQSASQRYTVSKSATPNAVYIIDIDSYTGGYAQFILDVDSDMYLAIGLTNANEIPVEQFLTKPIQLTELFEKLDALVNKNASHKQTTITSDHTQQSVIINTTAATEVKNADLATVQLQKVAPSAQNILKKPITTDIPNPIPTFDMSVGLLGHLLTIIRDNSNTTILFNDSDYWAVDVVANRIYMSSGVDSIEAGLQQNNGRLRQFFDEDMLATHNEPLSLVVWNIAYLTSNGRIPSTLKPSALLSLYKWPNLTRLTVESNTLRICAFLSRTPCNMLILTKMLNLDYREVFSLLSALQAIGLLRVVNKDTAQAIRGEITTKTQSEPVNIQKRSFLSKLLAKIKGV